MVRAQSTTCPSLKGSIFLLIVIHGRTDCNLIVRNDRNPSECLRLTPLFFLSLLTVLVDSQMPTHYYRDMPYVRVDCNTLGLTGPDRGRATGVMYAPSLTVT
jgi:hypothetical protein